MKYAIFPMLLLIAVSIGGCATSNCAGWSAIQPSRSDVLTDGTKRQILGHNEFGASIRTVGTFMKWLIVGLISILAGFVMVGESIVKIAAWIRD